ncbi:MAG TPA: hemolysin III family protein [Thermoanaerobaculia bacterium]
MSGTATFSYSSSEEIAHSVIHGLGIVASIAGLAVLVAFAALRGDAWVVAACSVFGTTLILLYVASTLYHSVTHARAKRVLQLLDHSAIYLLIAGTYTPFTLINLRGGWGWTLFFLVWALALCGIALTFLAFGRTRRLSLVLYLGMGWLILVAAGPLGRTVAPGGILLLVLGGAMYSLGVVFYVWRRLPFHHAVWHGFVLAGSVLHFFAVLLYAIPRA